MFCRQTVVKSDISFGDYSYFSCFDLSCPLQVLRNVLFSAYFSLNTSLKGIIYSAFPECARMRYCCLPFFLSEIWVLLAHLFLTNSS